MPATTGVAIDVPLSRAKMSPRAGLATGRPSPPRGTGMVEHTLTPGAAMSGFCTPLDAGPRLDELAGSHEPLLIDATATDGRA
jgi:hypothetical protein